MNPFIIRRVVTSVAGTELVFEHDFIKKAKCLFFSNACVYSRIHKNNRQISMKNRASSDSCRLRL